MDEGNIPIEEELDIRLEDDSAEWTEQISVAGGQLVETIQSLLREAVVRKITVVDKDGKTLIDLPLYAGIVGVALLGYWSILALVAAWFTEVSIRIVREEMPENVTDDVPVVSAEALTGLADRAGKSVSDVAERAGAGLGDLMARASKAASDVAAQMADSLEPKSNGNGRVEEPLVELPAVTKTSAMAEAEPQRCQAMTKAGTQCKRNAMAGSDYCSMHQPD